MLPNQSVQIDAKFSQYTAYRDDKLRVLLAKNFIKAKFARTQSVLNYLHSRYPVIRTDFSKEENMLVNAQSIPEIMMVEGRVASFYWQEWVKIIPQDLEFDTREHQKKPRGAGDVVNCLLNYGYSILEAECLRAINSAGLDCHIGFMHEKCNGKNSLAYDMQEPFRFLIDLAVISIIENKVMSKTDFIRTETYTLRLRPSGAKKLIAAIDKQFHEKSEHKGATWSWRYIIQDKTTELSHYLQGKRKKIEFITPEWKIERQDKADIREIIKNISYTKWEQMGFSKGTLNYMKKNAASDKPFTLNKHVEERILTTQF
jgi:CRISP-associated protein Cas1